MSDLDKDIELVSNLKNIELKGKVNEQYIYTKIPEEYLNAIENVLSELSNLKWKNEIYVKSIKSHKETIEKKDIEIEILKRQVDVDNIILEKQDKETETWKKIAEKLADKLVEIEDVCKQCIIDWARKEVENE